MSKFQLYFSDTPVRFFPRDDRLLARRSNNKDFTGFSGRGGSGKVKICSRNGPNPALEPSLISFHFIILWYESKSCSEIETNYLLGETFLFGMEPLKFHLNLEGWRSGFGIVPLMLKP